MLLFASVMALLHRLWVHCWPFPVHLHFLRVGVLIVSGKFFLLKTFGLPVKWYTCGRSNRFASVTCAKEPSSEHDDCGSSGFSKDPGDCNCSESEESSLDELSDELSLDGEPLELIVNTGEGWSRCNRVI